jgi:hypothetical protein
LANKAAAPRHGRRHHAHAGGLHGFFVQTSKFGGHLVVKAQVAGFHDLVVAQAKAQQHGFFDPLVGGPLADAFAGGHAQLARVELGNDVFDSVNNIFGC